MTARSIGAVVTEHIALGVVDADRVVGGLRRRSEADDDESLRGVPAEELVRLLAREIATLAEGQPVEAAGLAFPGIIRAGVILDSPNLPQLKGLAIQAAMIEALAGHGIVTRVAVSNDADAVAAGIAAAHGGPSGNEPVRVWTLGVGIGFGHHPVAEGVWEGGHMVVSLDPNENLCGCGGQGHLEGIMGHRAMRLRFLDREPEEVFAAAKTGEDARCAEFVIRWHRALAAAAASSIHLEGPGKFYITGMNARFVNIGFLHQCVEEMVKLSPLRSYVFEVVPGSDEVAVAGAVVNALN